MSMDFAEIDRLMGGRGKLETLCPECSHLRKPHNRKKPCLGLTRRDDSHILYACQNCGVSGLLTEGWGNQVRERPRQPPPSRQEDRSTAEIAGRIWRSAKPAEGTLAEVYWKARNLL